MYEEHTTQKTPTEVLTAELRGCCNGYIGAPALAVQCIAALRAAGWIIVRDDAIRLAQASHAYAEIRESRISAYDLLRTAQQAVSAE
jgi:hypothetical protein